MQAKQILMYESREEFYNWLINSDLAMDAEELKTNEKKKSLIIPQLQNVKTYEEYVNYFQCDSLQTMAWTTPAEGEKKPNVSLVPIHIASMQFVPEETPTCTCDKEEGSGDACSKCQ